MFIVTETRDNPTEVEGQPCNGSSFKYYDGTRTAVFHSFKLSSGKWAYTGLVPGSLRARSFDTDADAVSAVLELNTALSTKG